VSSIETDWSPILLVWVFKGRVKDASILVLTGREQVSHPGTRKNYVAAERLLPDCS
jgi:hypothetical protein